MINQVVDCVVIALLVIGAIVGAKKGFIKAVLKMCAGIISVVVAYLFTSRLSKVFYDKYVFLPIKEKIDSAVSQYLTGSDGEALSADALINGMPDSLRNIFSLAGYDVEVVANNAMEAGNDAIDKFVNSSASLAANVLSTIFAFVLLFFGTFILLRVLAFLLDAVFKKIPGISKLNSTLGFLFGLLCMIINIWIFSGLIISLIEAIRVSNPGFFSGFDTEKTIILKLFTSLNPILLFF